MNFTELLPNSVLNNEIGEDDIYVNFGAGHGPKIMKRGKDKPLSYTEWSEAYDTFMMIYIEEHGLKRANDIRLLLKDMLTYRNHVNTMMKEGGDWRGYDQHFRKLMETQKVSWATANFNLIWHYNNKTLANQSQQSNSTRPNNYKQGSVCKLFNTPLVRCPNSGATCNFGHFCTQCGNNSHPHYLCRHANRDTVGRQLSRGARATGIPKHSTYMNQSFPVRNAQSTMNNNVTKKQ